MGAATTYEVAGGRPEANNRIICESKLFGCL